MYADDQDVAVKASVDKTEEYLFSMKVLKIPFQAW